MSDNPVFDRIQSEIDSNDVVLFMKGSPMFPQCGFSSQVVQELISCGKLFAFVNILEHPDIRAELPKYANWPTFPQLWINEELVGGCDIIMELSRTGELAEIVTAAAPAEEKLN